MALRLRPGHRGSPEIGVAVPDSGTAGRPGLAGGDLGARPGGPSTPTPVSAEPGRPGVPGSFVHGRGRAAPSRPPAGGVRFVFVALVVSIGETVIPRRIHASATTSKTLADR